jgi:P4 family phage/plasmid primase-like protien
VITISTFRARASKDPIHATYESLAALAASMPHVPIERKAAAPLWSPAEYHPNTPRRTENVLRVHLAVIDLDHLTEDQARSALDTIEALGWRAWIHTSYSHGTVPGEWCLRVAIDVSRPLEPGEFVDGLWPRLAAIFPTLDRRCKDLARMFFVPSCPITAPVEPINVVIEGVPIDVDALLAEPLDAASETPEPVEDRRHKKAAIPEPQAGEITPEIRAYARRKLEELADRIRTTPYPGPVYSVLNDAAFRLGSYTPHILDGRDVREALRAAHRARTEVPALVEKNDRIVEIALADGAAKPWIPSPWGPLHDQGLADRLVRDHGERLRYVPTWGKWLEYDGGRWSSQLAGAEITSSIRALARSLSDESEQVSDGRAKALRAASTALGSNARIQAVRSRASSDERIHVTVDDLDRNPLHLVCANGTIDLESGELLESLPTHLDTRSTRQAYDRAAPCPRWERFLLEVCQNDVELVDYLHRAVGYSIQGTTAEQCLFFLHGDGSNGKSVFLDVLGVILGEYGTTMARDLLIEKRGASEHLTTIASLQGARLAISSEVNEGAAWNESLVKSLTGSDRITARRMREDEWTFQPTHKLWLSGNYRPTVKGSDHGIWRRMRLIPFHAEFAPGQIDRNLPEKLRAEAPGILAWAVRGCIAWQRRGLDMPRAVREATEDYRAESDVIGLWLSESFEITGESQDRIPRATLYASWQAWCARNGQAPWSAKVVAERMRRRVGEAKIEGTRVWTGIRARGTTGAGTFARVN